MKANPRFAAQNQHVELDKSAKKLLAKEGYDPQFSARPLKRTMQELLLDPLALKLLDGEFRAGDNLKVSEKDGGLVFMRK
jgi:ATP-dependent Clp protease ATP-binding subunit ClpA